MDKYLFSIPDSYRVRLLNRSLLVALKEHSEWFYDDFVIETAYGCPPNCRWNGGRGEYQDGYQSSWTGEVLKMYDSFGVKYRLVFSNLLLRKEHLADNEGNELCKIADGLGGYVMVSLPMMADYLQRRYKRLKVCWSTTTQFGKTTDDIIAKINQLSKDTVVVLPYQYNNKPEIEQLEHPENIEVLVNEMCIDNCPFRRRHWEDVSRNVLYNTLMANNCYVLNMYMDPNLRREHIIPRGKLPWYRERKILKLKISGRNSPEQCYGNYIHYMVKPGQENFFKDFVREYVRTF